MNARTRVLIAAAIGLLSNAARTGAQPVFDTHVYHQTVRAVLRGGPVEKIEILVDPSSVVVFDITSTDAGAVVQLAAPDGRFFAPDSAAAAGVGYATFAGGAERGSLASFAGQHHVFTLRAPAVGRYFVTVAASPPVAGAPSGAARSPSDKYALVGVSVLFANTLRLATAIDKASGAVGQPLQLLVRVSEEAGAVTHARAHLTVRSPNGAGQALTGRDDGADVDVVAGDGVYTCSFAPAEPGEYAVTALVDGFDVTGARFRRQAGFTFVVD